MDDESALDALLRAYEERWQSGDIERWSELFTADADFVTWRGIRWTSREEIVEGHEAVPADIVEQMPNYRLEPIDSHVLSPGVALVHAQWSWPRFVEAGNPPEDRRGLLTMVMVKGEAGWRIRASHNGWIEA